jgi:hypothetical protein
VPDAQLWTLTFGRREMHCTVAEIRDPTSRDQWDDRTLGVELRVEKDGELY